MSDAWDITSAVAAGLSAVAAAGSWLAAARANRTSRQAQSTAETVARIERDRRHEERRPRLTLTLGGLSGDTAKLDVHLDGPDELGEVEFVSIRVDDDDMDRSDLLPGEASRDDIDNHVWGPFRFTPRVNGADEHGRALGSFALRVGRGSLFQMERTRPGHWMRGKTMGQWQGEYAGHPVRLVITCRAGGEEWVLARSVPNASYSPGAQQ